MVNIRCKEKIRNELEKLGIVGEEINQGTIEFQNELTGMQLLQLQENLLELGFEVVDDTNSKLLDSISESVSELFHSNAKIPQEECSDYLAEKLGFDYPAVTKLFLRVYGMSLPRYIEVQRIERSKELLLYQDLSLEEVAALCQFDNQEQFRNAFRENTGVSPTTYKQIMCKREEC